MSKTADTTAPSSAPLEAIPPGAAPASLIARVQRILLKRWKEILIALVPCALFAGALGLAMGQNIYKAEGALLYDPPKAPTEMQGPTFDTWASTLLDPEVLAGWSREAKLDIPPAYLKKMVKVEPSAPGASKINLSLEWPDREQSAVMLNTLMKVFIADVDRRRRDWISSALDTTRGSLKDCQQRYEKADETYKTFARKAGVVDIKKELEKVKTDLAKAKESLNGPGSRLVDTNAQIKVKEREIETLKGKSSEEARAALEKRLKEIEAKMIPVQNELDANLKILPRKKMSLEVSAKLLRDKAITQETFDKEEAEVINLETNVKKGRELLKNFKEEFEAEKTNPTFPEMKEAQTQLKALKTTRAGIVAEIEEKTKELGPIEAQVALLVELQQQSEQTDQDRQALTEERKKLEGQLQELATLYANKRPAFSVSSEAQPPKDPLYNTAKKIAIPAFALPLLLVVGFLVARDMRTSDWQAESLAHQLGLSLLGRVSRNQGGRKEIDPAEARALALRLRQYVPEEGGTILFSPVNDNSAVDDLLAHVGRFLAMRDERVLILDGRIAGAEPAALLRHVERPVEPVGEGSTAIQAAPGVSGLVQFLVFEGTDPRQFIQPTGLGSVDFLPAGGPYQLTDVLASDPMKDLLKRLRKDYSVILVAGPAVTHMTDTEILAAYVHGIVVVLNGPVTVQAPLGEFFQSLREANAPLLGAVVCG